MNLTTKQQKQELVQKARKQGAGWSYPGGIFTTLYYALRSNSTIAGKVDSDKNADKNLINKIRKEQTLWSLSGAFGLGLVGLAPVFLSREILILINLIQ